MEGGWQQSVGRRIATLIIGGGYLFLLSILVRVLYEIPLAIAGALVIVNAAIIIAVIAVFCVKIISRRDHSWRVQLSTLFLPFVPLAIYLSLFRRVLEMVEEEAPNPGLAKVWPLIPVFVGFVVLTTAVLLLIGEAVTWCALTLYRRGSVAKRRDK